MPLLWLSLALAIVETVASATFAALRGLEAFRALKALGASVSGGVAAIEAAAAQIEQHLARAAESGSRLDAELAQLRRSRARLNVLRSALDDVRASVGRVTAVYPRK
jgi:uncharacterized protein YhaN